MSLIDELNKSCGLGALDPASSPYPRKPLPVGSAPTSGHADLRPHALPVRSQGPTSECVAFALGRWQEVVMSCNFGVLTPSLSPEELYNRIKSTDGNTYDGTWPEYGFDLLKSAGFAQESSYPFDPEKDRVDVPPKLPTEYHSYEREYRAFDYIHIDKNSGEDTFDSICRGMDHLGPILITIPVTYSFDVPNDGLVTLSGDNEYPNHMRGYHCIPVLGYDKPKNYIIIRNSWGAPWGDKGDGYLNRDWVNAKVMGAVGGMTNLNKIVGDLDANGYLQVRDVFLDAHLAVGFPAVSDMVRTFADVNGDGKVNVSDVLDLLKKVLSGG